VRDNIFWFIAFFFRAMSETLEEEGHGGWNWWRVGHNSGTNGYAYQVQGKKKRRENVQPGSKTKVSKICWMNRESFNIHFFRPTDAPFLRESNNIVRLTRTKRLWFQEKDQIALSEVNGTKLNDFQKKLSCPTTAYCSCIPSRRCCRKQLQELKAKFPTQRPKLLVEAALLCKRRNYRSCRILRKFLRRIRICRWKFLSYYHSFSLPSHVNQATQVLKSLGDVSYKPGVVLRWYRCIQVWR